MTDALALDVAVHRFIDDVAPLVEDLLRALPGRDPSTARRDTITEAFDLVCACIDADGLATDPELWALLKIFAPIMDSALLRSTPTAIREAKIIKGRIEWLETPSTMFDILAGVDARDGGHRARTYYDDALRVAYLVIALDSNPGRSELLAIERWRGVLLRHLDGAGVDRPVSGAPAAPGGPRPTDHTSGHATADDRATAEAPAPATDDELPPARPLEELLAELDDLIGMDDVKEEVRLVTALLEVQNLRRERDLPALETSRHLIFTGNPGTGKTTVARLLAAIYRTLGVVERGHLVETDRAGLVAGFVGQTATKTTEVFDRADQGVLIIDEAYALVRGSESDFGREAIDTIVKLVEDRRDRLVVIAAGYPDEMDRFVDANPGLRSRFPKTIHFPDYTTDELVAIFGSIAERGHYRVPEDTAAAVAAWLDDQPREKGFGNGRLVRNLFEAAVARQARRVVDIDEPTDDELLTLRPSDLPGGATEPDPADGHDPALPLDAHEPDPDVPDGDAVDPGRADTEAGRPDETDRPDEADRPDETDRPDEAGGPDETDRPEEAGGPEEADRPDEAGGPVADGSDASDEAPGP